MEDEKPIKGINKICGVCGDRALGYNFNAVSCESCKAFFRRNALKNKGFRCPFSENCVITPVTRRFCQKCRLDKCFEIGMRKEYIMSEEDKVLKRQRIEQNRAKRKLKSRRVDTEIVDDNSMSVTSDTYFLDSDERYTDLGDDKQMSSPPIPFENIDSTSPAKPDESSRVSQNLLEVHSTSDDYNITSSSKDCRENTEVESTTTCQASKDKCGNSEYIDYVQDSSFLMKIISQPNLVAKIFQDMSMVLKILANPKIMKKLTNDPEMSQFVKENNLVNANESIRKNDTCVISRTINSIMKNPILTDLISNSEKQRDTKSDDDILQDVERTPITADSIESILSQAINLEYSSYTTLGGTKNSRELNDTEMAKLNELIVANKALLAPLDEDITNLIGDEYRFKGAFNQSDPILLDLINLSEIAIRRLIKMSKKISAFKNMCQKDQLALLKGGCTEMMMLRSTNNYDPDKDSWKILQSQDKMSDIKVDVLKEAKGNLYAEHAKFVQSFDSRWRDENIILILSAITLFTPDRPKVVHSDVIKLEQNSYYYLLRRYLESIYPGCEAKSMFLKLIQKIAELHKLNEEVVGVYLNVNPSSIEPLLIEIFDLKH